MAAITITTETAAYSEIVTSGEYIRRCNDAAGSTVVLPSAVDNWSKITYKKIAAGGTITIDG